MAEQVEEPPVFITAEQAIRLLKPGARVHTFLNPAGMLVGCDTDRAVAVAAINSAARLEIGGDGCKRLEHALVVWNSEGTDVTFYECDMVKVYALEEELTGGNVSV